MKTIRTLDIKDFDIILVSSGSFLGNAIQDFTDSNINHVGIFVWLEGKLYVSEAERKGLQLVPFSEYLDNEKYKEFFLARLPHENISKEKKRNLKHFILKETKNHSYDFMTLFVYQPIKQISRKLFGRAVWLGKKDRKAKIRFVCSEWVAYVYNVFFNEFPEWYLTDPAEVKNSELFKIYKTKSQPVK